MNTTNETRIRNLNAASGLNSTLILILGESKCRKIHRMIHAEALDAMRHGHHNTAAQRINEADLMAHIAENFGWKKFS